MIFSVQPVKPAVEPVTRDPVNFPGHCPVRVLKHFLGVFNTWDQLKVRGKIEEKRTHVSTPYFKFRK